ncbi:MAG: hypothetical protein HRT71_14195 [Flavobacteriales bacterium]|nr:hypothetical protein [Flavobacteriales bacterium]
MRKVVQILFLIVLPTILFGQDSTTIKKFGITTSPLSILNTGKGPNINLGIDYHIKPKWVVYGEYGLHQPFMQFYYKKAWEDIEGFYIKQETRYRYTMERQKRAFVYSYVGLELMHGRQSYSRTDSIIDIPNTDNYELAYYNERIYTSIIANNWLQYVFDSNLEMALKFGMGIRFNNIKNEISIEESESRDLGDWTVPANYIQQKGRSIYPKFNFGMRLGYRF